MGLRQSFREAIHIDRVLIPSRGRRIFLYVLLIPLIGCAGAVVITDDYQFLVPFLACVVIQLGFWVGAVEKYVLSHDPIHDSKEGE